MASEALRQFRKLGGSAAGRWLFSRVVCWRAPYFASIRPTIDVLEIGRCVARIKHRRAVQNHIGTVHAIALCNLAELTAGVVTDASIPDDARWIPKGMTVRYLKKATGAMTATASFPPLPDDIGEGVDAHVTVAVRDSAGDVVFDADIAMWVSPRKR
jgi:acyl-coenzyme A thioesterase PaaI-like protein